MADFEVKRVLDIKAGLGEGVLWSVEEQALFWVDLHKKTMNRFDPADGSNQVWALPAMPGCFAFREGRGAVIATSRGYYDLDFATGAIEFLLAPPFDRKVFRFNDGKTDRQGRFWVGTVFVANFEEGRGQGHYFRYENGVAVDGLAGITVANGTAFSPDGRTMYHAESMSRTIFALDYDPDTGIASNERVFATLPEAFGIPDGATVDAEGYYWSATPFGEKTGSVVRFAPNGVLDLHIEAPVLVPTMVAFGGPDLSTLYIVSGRIEAALNRQPSEWGGDIFAVETRFRGLPETPYRQG
jgi:sugar lactone lactonase YvrE